MSDETPTGNDPGKDREKVLSSLPDKYHGSPWGMVALGLVLSVVGGFLMIESQGVGFVFLIPGGVLVQFGVIAAGVEYGLRRVDQERFFQ
ncbi:hypothetical protein ACIO3S_06415 [Nocardioides sp. NPDC087217]|uniref:hypothetical protein n=1 Tax=Nocardioides sp. NPDC087217 TaxID=3364335 RepID=UPI00382DE909